MSDGNQITPEELQLLREKTAELEKQAKLRSDEAASSAETLKSLQDQSAAMMETNRAREHAIATARADLDHQRNIVKEKQAQIKAVEAAVAAGATLDANQQKLLDSNKKFVEGADEVLELYEAQVESMEKMQGLAGNVANAVGVNKEWKKSWWGQVADGSITQNLSNLGKSLAEALNPADVLGSTLMKIQESTIAAFLAFDASSASLAAATGQGTRYNDMIMDVADSNRGFGVGIQESAQAIRGLTESMSGFTALSDEAAGSMAAQAAQLERLGVAATTTGAVNDQLMKGMGMTAQQAMATNNELARTAMGIGVPVAKMAQEFEAALPQLAAWGDQAPKIFKKVMAAAKGLGVEMNTLLGFASQFDTFEGAATAVGKLNNILGGDVLNSYDMLNASEEERIEMLLRGVDASGKSWESMSRFEKMAVANAAGITDMAEANKMFAGGLGAYQDAQRAAEQNAVSQAELEKRTQAAVSVGEKFQQIIEAMAVGVQPLVGFMHGLTNAILAVNDATGGFLVPVVLAAIAAYALFYQGVKMAMTIQQAKSMFTKKDTVEQALNTAAKNADTVSQGANNVAKNASITASIRLGAVTAANTAKTWLAVAAERALALGRWILAGASSFLAWAFGAQATAQTAVATTSVPAAAGTGALSAGLTALGANPFAVAAVLLLAALALGMGMAAIAAGIMVFSLVQLVKAFMSMPGAIVPALLGLTAFMAILLTFVAVVAGMGPIALAFAVSAALIGAGLQQMAPGLLAFSVAMAIFAGALMVMKAADAFDTMWTLMYMMPLFGLAMAITAPLIYAAGIMAPALAGLGAGFAIMAVGLFLMTFAIPSMILLSMVLPLFAVSLYAAAPFLWAAALFVAPAAALLGIGLGLLGASLMLFDTSALAVMAMLGPTLALLAVSLFFAAPFMYAAGIAFAPAAIAVGLGLLLLGASLRLFDKKSYETILTLSVALIALSVALTVAAIPMMVAALLFAPAALLVGIGLGVLGLALGLFDRKTAKTMEKLAGALVIFSLGLAIASIPMFIAGILFSGAAVMVAIGLATLGLALLLFDGGAIKAMSGITENIVPFASAMMSAGWRMFLGGPLFYLGSAAAAVGIVILGAALTLFPSMAIDSMKAISEWIVPFAQAMLHAAPLLLLAGVMMFAASLFLFPAMFLLAGPLMLFGKAMSSMVASFAELPTAKAQAMGDFFKSLASLTGLTSVAEVMWNIASGIYGVSLALALMPEEKAFALSEVVSSVTEASVKVTPEAVENVTGLVEQAAAYADVQAKFKAPSVDAFVQALKQVNSGEGSGSKTSGSKPKRDIVLELNGRELGRAIDVHLDDKHNLRSS